MFANSLAYEMKKVDCEVSVVAIAHSKGEQLYKHPGIEYAQMSRKEPGYARAGAFLKLSYYLKKYDADFVVAHGIYPLVAASIFKKAFPRTKLIYRNMSVHHKADSSFLKSSLKAKAIRSAVARIFPNEKQKDDVLKSYGLGELSAVVLPRGVDYSSLSVKAERSSVFHDLNLDKNEKLIVHIGAFEPVKNHYGLVSVIQKVMVRDSKLRFVLIGDGYLRYEIEAQLPNNVFSLGFRGDAERFIAAADAVILTSHSEGFGAVLAEASAYGVPSVAYDVGGISTVIKSGMNGILVPHEDEDAFCDALLSIVNISDDQRRKISGQAIEHYKKNFSMTLCADRYFRLMKELAS